jgi:hypothetical protein
MKAGDGTHIRLTEVARVAGDTELEEAFTVRQAAQVSGLSEHTLQYG